jgi:hypothetical protein
MVAFPVAGGAGCIVVCAPDRWLEETPTASGLADGISCTAHSANAVVVLLLGWLLWFGFGVGVLLRIMFGLPSVRQSTSPFGFRRRR